MAQASFIDGKTFDEFSQGLFNALISCSQISNTLPDTDDQKYFATFPSYQLKISQIGESLLRLKQRFLDHNQSDAKITDLENEDLEEVYNERIVDCVDNILDKVDAYIDDCKGEKTKTTVINQGANIRKETQINRVQQSMNILRPQDKFIDRIDNSYGNFVPRITCKPNAVVPLPDILISAQRPESEINKLKSLENATSVFKAYEESNKLNKYGQNSYPHPYEHELKNLTYLPHQLAKSTDQIYQPIENSKPTWVSTTKELKDMIEILEIQQEIAVDLEAHQHRSYQGLTCLMQISTRKEDFLVDTLALMRSLECLNKVFTNPKITKVLHGAGSDIEWLQRDFGLYIVNMFDTGQAARLLEFESFGLGHLLKYFCDVTADKQYQLADWRIRPLSDTMKKYAQEDTHYLLFIYDRMKSQAITKGAETNNNLLMTILNRSRDLCLTTYNKYQLTSTSYLKTYETCDGVLNPKQIAVFQSLFSWRDKLAREIDESLPYVMPNRIMYNIAKSLPLSTQELLQCCNPIPPVVRTFANDLVLLIQDSLEKPQSNNFHEETKQQNTETLQTPEKKNSTSSYNPQVSPSPLTTEQLYSRAGWIENSTPSTDLSVIAVLSKKNEGYITNTPQPYSLYVSMASSEDDDDDDSDGSDEDEEKNSNTASKIRDTLLLVPHKLNFNEIEKDEDEEEEDMDILSTHKVHEPEVQKDTKKDKTVMEEIPQSMVEIYQLSNKNRKNKNKNKMKKKEEKSNNKDVFEMADEIHSTKRRNRDEVEPRNESRKEKGMKRTKKT